MNTKLNFFKTAGIIAVSLVLSNCGENKKKDPHHIKVGVASGPELKVAEAAKKVAKEKYGLEVELVSFNDYVIPNEALSQGDIDANAFQHKPYLDEQSKQRGYKLAIIGKTFVYPIAAYSKK
jgi:D-methionine transport system substrate-binding protein